jgi:hypothetical protein
MSACVPTATLLVYPVGAEGYTLDPGWAFYSPMSTDFQAMVDSYGYMWGAGAGAYNIRAHTLLQLGQQAVAIPRPEPNFWHTELTRWTETVGTWEERTPYDSSSRLHTFLVCGETEGQLDSTFTHQESPAFMWGTYVTCPTQSYDVEADPPFLSISWGLADAGPPEVYRYGLWVWADGTCELFEEDSTATTVSLGTVQLSWRWPMKSESTSVRRLEMMVIPLCGGIALRLTDEDQWHFFKTEDRDLAVGTGGTFTFSYQGSSCHFMFGGITGPLDAIGGDTITALTTQVIGADRVRAVNPTPQERSYVPTLADPEVAAALSVTAIDHTTTDEVEINAQFTWGYTAARQGGGDVPVQADCDFAYRFAHFPELYAVGAYFSPTTQPPDGAAVPVDVFSDTINAIDVDLNDEADSTTMRLSGKWRVYSLGAFGDWLYNRYVSLNLGYKYTVGPDVTAEVFTGYISTTRIKQVTPGLLHIDATGVDCSVKARNHQCDDAWPVMDGWDAEDAALHAMAKVGIDATRCSFGALAGIDLSLGLPERPLWVAGEGQSPWDFLERIARYCLCEVTVGVDGTFGARAIMYVDTGTSTTFLAGAYRDVDIERRNAYGFTGVEVRGETQSGSPLLAWSADTDAESNPAYAFFRGYRRLEKTQEPAIQDLTLLEDLRDLLYTTLAYRQGDLLTWTVDGNITLVRRQVCVMNGLAAGLIYLAGNRVAVMSIHHHWGPNRVETYTTLSAVGYPT